MRYDLIVRELCRRYAPRRPEMRSAKDYYFGRRVASLCGEKLPLPEIDTQELNRFITMIESNK